MAKKVHKKPKHTNLVLPSDKKDKKKEIVAARDRMGRRTAEEAARYTWRKGQDEPAEESLREEMQAGNVEDVPGAPGEGHVLPADADDDGLALMAPPQARRVQHVQPEQSRKDVKREKSTRKKQPPLAAPPDKQDELPGNAIAMPRKNPRVAAVRRKKRWRRIRVLIVFLILLGGVLFYVSGLYVNAAMKIGEAAEGFRISMQPGNGFPMAFSMTGYIKAEEMGNTGFAVLGGADMAIVSSTGRELNRIQHGYVNPGMAAGLTRVCVYSRGGKEYVVEGRQERIAYRTTEHDILFAEMSRAGWLGVVTTSRFRATLDVYGPEYDEAQPNFSMPFVDEEPVMMAFHTDNRYMAVGCLSARDGALGTTIYVLRTDRTDVQAQIRADGAVLLSLHYTKNGQVLAVFDAFAALYGREGTELARYDYGGRSLATADYYEGNLALCFGSETREKAEIVLLDGALVPLFSTEAQSAGGVRVLASGAGVYLATGQEVFAYDLLGRQLETKLYTAKFYGLVRGSEALVITAEEVDSIAAMLEEADSSLPAGVSGVPGGSAAASSPAAGSAPPPEDGTDTGSGTDAGAEGA